MYILTYIYVYLYTSTHTDKKVHTCKSQQLTLRYMYIY